MRVLSSPPIAKGHFKVISGSHVVFDVVDSYKLPPLFNRTAGAIFLTHNIWMVLKQTLKTADAEGFWRHGVCQSQKNAVEAAAVVEGQVRDGGSHLPVRQRDRKTASLPRVGFRSEDASVAPGDAAA